MAVGNYEFELPDGRIFVVEGAPSREDALAYVDYRWPTLRRQMPIEGFFESAGQQFRSQITSPVGAAVAGAAAIDAPETRAALQRFREGLATQGDTQQGTRAPELRDLASLNVIDALKAYAGQAAGSIGGILAGGLAGAGIGAVAAGVPTLGAGAVPGAVTGARIGVSGSLLAGGIDELYQGLTAEGVDPQLAGRISVTLGPIIGRIENRYVEQALSRALGNQVAPGVVSNVTQRILGGRAGGIRQTAAGGAAGEILGETLRQGTIGVTTGEANLAERAERVAEAGLVGTIGGAGTGTAVRAIGRAGPSEAERQQQAAADTERQADEQRAAQQPQPAAPAQGFFPQTPIPQSPELLRTPEDVDAAVAANPSFAPPPGMATPEARAQWVNSARQNEYLREVGRIRTSAISNFAATQPDTFLGNLVQAAAEGNLTSLNRFSAIDVANAALRSSGIEPRRLTKDERQFVTEQLNRLAEEGILAKPTATSYSVSFGPRQQAAEAAPTAAALQREREASLREVADLNAAIEAGTLGQVDPLTARRFGAETLPRQQPAPEAAPAVVDSVGAPIAVGDRVRTTSETGNVNEWTVENTIDTPAGPRVAVRGERGERTSFGSNDIRSRPDRLVRVAAAPEAAPAVEPPVPPGMVRLYHGSATPGRYTGDAWFSSSRTYAENYRGPNTELQYVDVPASWANQQQDPDGYGQGVTDGFTLNIEIKGDQFGPRRPLRKAEPAQPAARTTVNVGGVQRETTPERLQQTVDDIRAGRPAANPTQSRLAEVPGIDPATVEEPSNPRGPERSPEKSQPGQMTQQNPPQEWSPVSDNTPEADVDLTQTANGVYSPLVGQLPPDTATAHATVKRATRMGMGFMGRWFYSPILTASKLNPAVRPVGRVMNAMRRRGNQYNAEIQPLLAEGAGNLTSQQLERVARLREESSTLGREAPGVATLSEPERAFFNSQVAANNRAWDYWTAANAINYFDPTATTDPVAKARLNEFWRRNRNKDLWEIPQAELREASPEGFRTMQEFERVRNPYYLPMTAQGTHFIAAYKRGADGQRVGKPVKMVSFNPLPLNKKGGRRPDPEVFAREELARRGFTPDKFYITPAPVEFTRDQEASALRDGSDALAKFLKQLDSVRSIRNDSEAQNLLRSFMSSLDKAAAKDFMRPNQGIMIPFTALDAGTYLTDVVPRHMAALGKLQARTYTNKAFNRAIENLDAPNKEYFNDLRDYASRPVESMLVARLKTLGFHYFIGPALDSMMMNFTSTYNSTMPLLMRDSGNVRQTLRIGQGALNDAIKYLGQAVRTDTRQFDNAVVNAGRTPKEREALRRAAQLGAFPPAMTVDMGAISEGVRTQTLINAGIPKAASVAKAFNTLINLFGKPQQASEQINRAAAFLAAFRLAEVNPAVIERANRIDGYNFTGPDASFEYAMSRVDDSQFIMTPEDRAKILRATPVNEVAFQFMSYPFKMTEVFLRQGANALRGVREGNPELAKVGALGLAYYTVPLVVLAGVWGFPGAELLRDALEEVIKLGWKDVENFDQDLYEYAFNMPLIGGEFTADFVTRGLPHALGMFTGSTRLGLNPFQFQDLMAVSPALLLGPVGSLPGMAVDAYKFAKEGDYLNSLASILPRFAGNFVRGINLGYGTGEVRTPEGRTTITREQIAELDKEQGVPTWIRVMVGLPPPEFLDLRTARRYAEEYSKASRPYTEWANNSISRLIAESVRAQERGDNEAALRFDRELDQLRADIRARNDRLRARGRNDSVYLSTPATQRAIMDRVRDRLEGTTEAERLIQRGAPRSRETIRQMLETRGMLDERGF